MTDPSANAVLGANQLDVRQDRDIEHPRKAVEGKQGVFVEVVDKNEEKNQRHPQAASHVAGAQQRPELSPCPQIAEREERQAGKAEFQPNLEKAVMRMKDDEAEGGGDLERMAFESSPECGRNPNP